ncbi:hypothetical protein Q31a_29410 [Aureliella helgolandensis]|uniref:Uncharacterized protein n=1 Tax=Aureliella helgolandensis TaxID=2527968 RepID=A0A518G7Q9_9BACT|nr:hypothetical protein Q31a_29410 [Aureliella helgolandensis]
MAELLRLASMHHFLARNGMSEEVEYFLLRYYSTPTLIVEVVENRPSVWEDGALIVNANAPHFIPQLLTPPCVDRQRFWGLMMPAAFRLTVCKVRLVALRDRGGEGEFDTANWLHCFSGKRSCLLKSA